MSTNSAGAHPHGQPPAVLLETGIAGLDRILGGGLRPGTMTMLIGAPGTGKTVSALQMAFAVAARGATALVLTGYSEPHDKLLAHNHAFTFFAPAALGTSVQLFSLIDLLKDGAAATEDEIVSLVRRHEPALVVLDGFRSMRRFLTSDLEVAQFLYMLGAKLALLGTTLLVTAEGDPEESARYPELTLCDVILALHRVPRGSHFRRLLDVVKVRGATALDGVHPFTIDTRGVTVYPRFETTLAPAAVAWSEARASLGVPALDALVGGGLTRGTTTLVPGSPGVGKTLLGLHFAADGTRRGEPTLFVGFMEDAVQLRAKARTFGLDLDAAEAKGILRLLVLPGYGLEVDHILDLVRTDMEQRGVRRLVLDSISEIERGIDEPARTAPLLAALVSYLRRCGVTSYVTLDLNTIVGPELAFTDLPLSVLAENLLLLRYAEYQGQLHRIFATLKLRFSAYDHALREYTITAGKGIELLGTAPAGVGLLTGIPQPLPPPAASAPQR